MDAPLVLEAPAKLNLCLRVIGRRADGYHLLQSLVVFLDLADRVALKPAVAWSMRMIGPFAAQLAGDDNLALRAGRLIADHAGHDTAACAPLAAAIEIDKNIPVAAGLGGGAAEAAAVLRGLASLWQLDLPPQRLRTLAAPLGADLAVCLGGSAARVGGVGEELAPLSLPALHLLLVNPGIAVATADVFGRLEPPYERPLEMPAALADTDAAIELARRFGNSLRAPAISLCPTIAQVLDELSALPSCRMAQMSGSGATCFGVFDDADETAAAAAALRFRRPAWFVRACRSLAG